MVPWGPYHFNSSRCTAERPRGRAFSSLPGRWGSGFVLCCFQRLTSSASKMSLWTHEFKQVQQVFVFVSLSSLKLPRSPWACRTLFILDSERRFTVIVKWCLESEVPLFAASQSAQEHMYRCTVCVAWRTSDFHGVIESLTVKTPGWSQGRDTKLVDGWDVHIAADLLRKPLVKSEKNVHTCPLWCRSRYTTWLSY